MTGADREHIKNIINKIDGGFSVSRGRKIYPFDGDGFIAENDSGEAVGVAVYDVKGGQCELTLIEVFEKRAGAGTMLVDNVVKAAKNAGCTRLWLVTTNDNLDAMKFYEKLGFKQKAVYPGAMTGARKIKPSIPVTGKYGIEINDEIEYEYILS
jgi:ribosomal protein S18 acetylase RimI-like enzyme